MWHRPTADEIATAVSNKLKDAEPLPNTSSPTSKSPASATNVVPPPVVPTAPQPAITYPCRADQLSECSDDQLQDSGRPVVAKIEAIQKDNSADLKKLEDIKRGNWFGEIVGEYIGGGGDKDSSWLGAYALAQEKAADSFRDCCAQKALAYHKELTLLLRSSQENTTVYEWAEELLKPNPKPKEWKKLTEKTGTNLLHVMMALHSMQFDLEIARNKRVLHPSKLKRSLRRDE